MKRLINATDRMVRTHPLSPARPGAFSSPLHNPRVAVSIGRWLGICFTICFLTGLYSHYLQEPASWMSFPTRPVWLYRVNQGLHVATGIASIPLLLAKLWIVYPRLFEWPPVRSIAHGLERLSIAVFLASALLQLFMGLLNTLQWYPWPFTFRETHFFLGWVIIGSLLVH
ncbi:MAG: molybdopterin-dependent oxidoreductase, partial [Mycobacteriales bacterium]